MACFHPLKGYEKYSGGWTSSSKEAVRSLLTGELKEMSVPCGQCIGCRLERSRQWAIRCVHEASLHQDNCFVTLTYATEFLPANGSLDKRDFVLFMKRLRKRFGEGIRFFHCGEYGEKFCRPHHHVCLFNFDFPDKQLLSQNLGNPIYVSKALSELWPYGYSSIGSVTFESAAYVARYIMKKINGDMASEHYDGRQPEYITMSRRPGIAAGWFEQFSSDCYPKDFITIKGGIKCRPPKYYDRLYRENHGEEFYEIMERRKHYAIVNSITDEDLSRKEQHLSVITKRLKRPLH